MDLEAVVQSYFQDGLSYKDILMLLEEKNSCNISIRTLKRILKRANLQRRKNSLMFLTSRFSYWNKCKARAACSDIS